MTSTHTEPLGRSTPEAQGIPSAAVLDFVDAAEQSGLEVHSLMVLRHGRVVAEGWWAPYAPERPHLLYSLSKSFAATAAGLAIAEGRFSLDDPVLGFFPEDAPDEAPAAAPSENRAALRVRHLLSMATGHDKDTTRALFDAPDGNWARAFLALPIAHAPGTHFVYNSGATYMVSAIVQKATGQTLLDYLGPRLFAPLGIQGATWESCPRGVNVGGWGLSVKTAHIARFGQLYLQKGEWNGQRVLPKTWVAEATARQVGNGDPAAPSDWSQGYGYQFWRCRHNAYRGDGAFGQFCVVLPDQNAVVAITANVGDMQAVLNLIWEHLLPAMEPAALPPSPAAAHERLRERLAGLALPAPQQGEPAPNGAAALRMSGKTYRFGPNEQGLETITFDFGADGCALRAQDKWGTHHVSIGTVGGAWRPGKTTFLQRHVWPVLAPSETWSVAAAGAWTAADTFTARLCFYETPFTPSLVCRFVNDQVSVDLRGAVGFGPAERRVLQGSAVQ